MKKLLLFLLLTIMYNVHAQVNVYWRNEAPNGNWEWGSTCEAGSDGNWYFDSWGGNRKRPDCFAKHYIHFTNNNQPVMNLNSNDDFSMNKIFFDPGIVSRTINTSNGKKLFFEGNPSNTIAKIENYSTVNHTINVQVSMNVDTEFNPINGDLTLNGQVNTFGHTINIYGNGGKTLTLGGDFTGAGSLRIKDNTILRLTNTTTLTGTIVAEQGILKISGNQTMASLTINSGAQLIVETGASLTVTGALTNNGTVSCSGTITAGTQLINNASADNFVINNNGALLQSDGCTTIGTIKIIKNSNPLYRLDYTLWSAPITGQTLRNFSMGTSNNRFYEYVSSATQDEGYYPLNPLTTYFTAGKGFLIRMPNSIAGNVVGTTNGGITTPAQYTAGTGNYYYNGTFTGTPNTGTITYPLYTAGNRYTAIGNPYPSPINIANFFTANSSVLDGSGAIYFWRKRNDSDSGTYATLTLADFNPNGGGTNAANMTGGQDNEQYYVNGNSANWTIAPGQGFIVKTAAAAPVGSLVTFTNSMRKPAPATGSQAFLKSGAGTLSRLRVALTAAEGGFSQASVVYMPQGTTGLDYGYDGKKLAEPGLSLYTLAENTALSIQARPEFDLADVVPMGFTVAQAGSYTITLTHTDGVFANGQKIYLNDTTEGILRDMATGGYTFTSEAGTFEGRFKVVYTTAALGTAAPVADASTVMVYQNGGTININSGYAIISSVTVFDIGGRKLYSADKINATEAAISSLTPAQQVLLVQLNTDKGTVTKKIVF
jgi:hypothetical protein